MARTYSTRLFAFGFRGWAVTAVCTLIAVAALGQQARTPTPGKAAVEARQGRSGGPVLRVGGAPTTGPKSARAASRPSQVFASTSQLQTVTLTHMGGTGLSMSSLPIT